jgi:site-specific DNA recombinase
VHQNDARGEPIRGGRTINEGEAAVVRRIFSEFAAGKSPRRIAVDLNRDAVPGPRGGQWDASTVNGNATRGTGILNNELYIGRLVWNRLRYIKDPATGRRISRLNASDRWIVQEVPELRLIPQDIWDAVKERQQSLKRNTRPDLAERPFWAQQRPRFLITGLAKCGALRRELREDQRQPVWLRRRAQPRHLQQPAQHPARHARRDDPRRVARPADGAGAVQDLLRRV